MVVFKNQTSLLIQRNEDDTYLVAVGERIFEGTHVSINFVTQEPNGDIKYFAGMDDPYCFELYENVIFDCDVYIENDESISVDLRLKNV
jgi:hypothetical protein